MNLRNWILFGVLLLLPFAGNSQRMWKGAYNRLGLKAGVNHFNIKTEDLPVSGGTSWTAGFTTRSSFYDDFQFIYGIQFFDLKAKVTGRDRIDYSTPNEEINFSMIGVQGSFLGSYKIMDHFLSVEAGPVIQVNGQFNPRQDRELWYIDGYDYIAKDLRKVSPFNVNFAVGVSGGFEQLKFWAQYQHGLNNFLGKLNKQGLEEVDPNTPEFNGRIKLINVGVAVFL